MSSLTYPPESVIHDEFTVLGKCMQEFLVTPPSAFLAMMQVAIPNFVNKVLTKSLRRVYPHPRPLKAELAGVAANEGRMPVNGLDGHSSCI